MNLATAGNLRAVTDDTVVIYHGVVADVNAFHDKVVIADACFTGNESGTVDDDVFANCVAVTDNECGAVAFILEVLWHSAENSALKDRVTAAHTGSGHDADVRINDTMVTDFHVTLNVSERVYSDVGADFGSRVNECLWTDVTHNVYYLMVNPVRRRGHNKD